MSAIWQDQGTWIALGISALFVVVAFVMHRAFVKVLQSGVPPQQESPHE